MNKICVIVRAVIINSGHILLCKTKSLTENFYFLPGGHIEPGETAKTALMRELQEEIGYLFDIGQYLGCVEHFHLINTISNCHDHDYSFVFKASNADFKFINSLKQPEAGQILEWIKLDHLANIKIKPDNLNKLLAEWLAEHAIYHKSLYTYVDSALLSK